jgi:hypothetical protein
MNKSMSRKGFNHKFHEFTRINFMKVIIICEIRAIRGL